MLLLSMNYYKNLYIHLWVWPYFLQMSKLNQSVLQLQDPHKPLRWSDYAAIYFSPFYDAIYTSIHTFLKKTLKKRQPALKSEQYEYVSTNIWLQNDTRLTFHFDILETRRKTDSLLPWKATKWLFRVSGFTKSQLKPQPSFLMFIHPPQRITVFCGLIWQLWCWISFLMRPGLRTSWDPVQDLIWDTVGQIWDKAGDRTSDLPYNSICINTQSLAEIVTSSSDTKKTTLMHKKRGSTRAALEILGFLCMWRWFLLNWCHAGSTSRERPPLHCSGIEQNKNVTTFLEKAWRGLNHKWLSGRQIMWHIF